MCYPLPPATQPNNLTMPKNQITQELEKEFSQGNLKPSQLKKSRSAEELKPASEKQATLQAENTDLRIQLAELTRAFDQAKKVWEQEKNALTDQNNELRLQHLKDSDALKLSQKTEDEYFTQHQQSQQQVNQLKMQIANLQRQFTRTQQDLKSAQRIIELRTINLDNDKNQESPFDYWVLIRFGLLAIIFYLSLNNQENNHGKLRN